MKQYNLIELGRDSINSSPALRWQTPFEREITEAWKPRAEFDGRPFYSWVEKYHTSSHHHDMRIYLQKTIERLIPEYLYKMAKHDDLPYELLY